MRRCTTRTSCAASMFASATRDGTSRRDVIPQIVSVVAERRQQGTVSFQMPAACPVCGSAVVRDEAEKDHRCSGGLYCPAQCKQALLHFAAGAQWTSRLARSSWTTGRRRTGSVAGRPLPARPRALAALERMAEKSAANCWPRSRRRRRPRWRASSSRSDPPRRRKDRARPGQPFRLARRSARCRPGPSARGRRRRAGRGGIDRGLLRRTAQPRGDRATAGGWRALADGKSHADVRARPLAGMTFVLTGTLPTLTREQAIELIVAAVAGSPVRCRRRPASSSLARTLQQARQGADARRARDRRKRTAALGEGT